MTKDAEKIQDPLNPLRGFLVLDAAVRLLIWGASMTAALWALSALGAMPRIPTGPLNWGTSWGIAKSLIQGIIFFNFAYVLVLILLRAPIPTPKPGEYSMAPGEKLDRQLVWSCLIATLTKARYEAPFPGFLVFHAANVPPLAWLMSPVFGPKSKSCYVTEPNILDPHMVTLGRNVVIGFGSSVAGHYQEHNRVIIKPTIIEDDVLIGAHVAMSGVHLKTGSVIGAGSVVIPGSVVGRYEYWSGNPARRRSYLRKEESPPASDQNRDHQGAADAQADAPST